MVRDGRDGRDGRRGPKGDAGAPGPRGPMAKHEWLGTQVRFTLPDGSWGNWVDVKGIKGEKGDNGISAYQIALFNGFAGTEEDWLKSLVGKDGADGRHGKDALTPYEIAKKNGITLTEKQWLKSLEGQQGPKGERGPKGEKGDKGDQGEDGLSAYEVWLREGHKGTEKDFFDWLAAKVKDSIKDVYNKGGGPLRLKLNDLRDVNTQGVVNGQVLMFLNGEWIAGAGGGGGFITATEIGYGSAANTLTSDPQATRDPVTHETYISQTQGGQTASLVLDTAFALPGLGSLPFVGSNRTDAGGTAIFGVVDASGLGGTPYTGVGLSLDTGTGFQSIFVFSPDRISFDTQDGSGNTGALTVEAGVNATASLYAVDSANDRYGFAADLNGGFPRVRIRGVDQTDYLWPVTIPSLVTDILTVTGISGNTVTLGWSPAPSGGSITIGDPVVSGTPDSVLFIDASGNLSEDPGNFTYSPTGNFLVRNSGGRNLLINPGGTYGIGDIDAAASQNYLFINDGVGVFTVSASDLFQIIDTGSKQYFKLDASSQVLQLGDAGNVGGKTQFQINDFAKQVFIQTDGDFGVQTSLGQRVIHADLSAGFQFAAGDVNTVANGSRVIINDPGLRTDFYSQDFYFRGYDNTVGIFAEITPTYSDVMLGDGSSAKNLTLFRVIDSSKAMTANVEGLFSIVNPVTSDLWLAVDTANRIYAGGDTLLLNNGFRFALFDSLLIMDFACPLGEGRFGDIDGSGNATRLIIDDANSRTYVLNRFQHTKGTNVTAANDLVLNVDGNSFTVTGNTQINAITTSGWRAGSEVILIFSGTPLVKDNTAGGAGTAPILLAGSTDLSAAANTVLKLLYDGTQWQEVSRKVA